MLSFPFIMQRLEVAQSRNCFSIWRRSFRASLAFFALTIGALKIMDYDTLFLHFWHCKIQTKNHLKREQQIELGPSPEPWIFLVSITTSMMEAEQPKSLSMPPLTLFFSCNLSLFFLLSQFHMILPWRPGAYLLAVALNSMFGNPHLSDSVCHSLETCILHVALTIALQALPMTCPSTVS